MPTDDLLADVEGVEAERRAVGKGRAKVNPLLDWQYDINESARRSARWAWAIAALMTVIALAAMGALASLAPLKSVEPIFVRVDAATGGIDVLHRIDEVQGLDKDEALAKGNLARYVYAREGYFRPRLQEDYRRVLRMSVGDARADYVREMNRENPDAPTNVYGDKEEVEIHLKSITFVPDRDGLAQVRYVQTVRDDQGKETRSHHVATILYGYEPDTEIPLSALIDNPLGFAVSEYAVEREDAS